MSNLVDFHGDDVSYLYYYEWSWGNEKLLNTCFSRYERFEVLAVFASTILAQLGAMFIIKERYIS